MTRLSFSSVSISASERLTKRIASRAKTGAADEDDRDQGVDVGREAHAHHRPQPHRQRALVPVTSSVISVSSNDSAKARIAAEPIADIRLGAST